MGNCASISQANPAASAHGSETLTPHRTLDPMGALQHALGNQAVQRLAQGGTGELVVHPPNDAHEREADRIADRAIEAGTGASGITPTRTGASVQRAATGGAAISPEISGAHGAAPAGTGGQPLDARTRAAMESRIGFDFSGVRVHTGEHAAVSADALAARAYTAGSDIVFARGAYAPETREGSRLLAHELAHVAQQREGIARQPADDGGFIPMGPLKIDTTSALAHGPSSTLRGQHTVTGPKGTWAQRVMFASGEPGLQHRNKLFLDLINEAVAPDAKIMPELRLPVRPFVSDRSAKHGDVLLDTSDTDARPNNRGLYADTRPDDSKLEDPPRVFIVMTPKALHTDGEDFTRQVIYHEYVHLLQKSIRQFMDRPACKGFWKQPLGGNPYREIVAVSMSFARFFPTWASTADPATTKFPEHIYQDAKLFHAYFGCVDAQTQDQMIALIVANCANSDDHKRLLLRLLKRVRDDAVPDLSNPKNNGMERLAEAIGRTLPVDPRLPPPAW